jgi:hypothetical protein
MPEADRILYVDQSNVLKGKLDDLRVAIGELSAFVQANEPRIRSYNVYFSTDGSRMTVTHEHDDAESLAFHMEVAGPLFSAVGKFIRLSGIDVYGWPGRAVLEQLEQKAAMLGPAPVTIHEKVAGFGRR